MKWDEILRDILNGKLRIVQNKKKHTETETEDEDEDEDDEEMPEEAGKMYDTSEKDGRYAPIRTDPENDVIQIHTDGEMPQCENLKINIGGQTETPIDRIDTVPYLIKEIFGYEKSCLFYRPNLEPNKRYTQAEAGNSTEAARFRTGEHDATRHIVKPLKSPGERRGNVIRFIRQSRRN